MTQNTASHSTLAGAIAAGPSPAGVDHRFLGFIEDLAVRVIFYGPEGGERDA